MPATTAPVRKLRKHSQALFDFGEESGHAQAPPPPDQAGQVFGNPHELPLPGVVAAAPMLPPPRFEPGLDQLRAAIGPRTRALVFNHPHNPSRRIYGADLAGLRDSLSG